MPKRIASILILLAFALLLCTSCGLLSPIRGGEKDSQTSAGTDGSETEPDAEEPSLPDVKLYQDENVWFCNWLCCADDPPFSVPEDFPEPSRKSGAAYRTEWMDFKPVSRQDFDAFREGMREDGFLEIGDNDYYCYYRQDCLVRVIYIEQWETIQLYWYQKSPYAPEDGMSGEEAAALFDFNAVESETAGTLLPIDITPQGFFERTGGQLFAVPYYVRDVLRAQGKEVSPNGSVPERMGSTVCYIKGEAVAETLWEMIAVFDADGDGADEIILFSDDMTSGIDHTLVFVISNGSVDYASRISLPFAPLSHREDGVVIAFEGYDRDLEKMRCFQYDIFLETENGDRFIGFTCRDETGEIVNSSRYILSDAGEIPIPYDWR